MLESEIFLLPPVPSKFDIVYNSKHYSEPDKLYNVNLFKLTCNCPDFLERSSLYQPKDVRLVCKHILDKLKYAKLYQSYSNRIALLLHWSAYFNDNIFISANIKGYDILFSTHKQSQWINLHIEPKKAVKDGITGFSYNVINRYWQNDRPAQFKELEEFIRNEFELKSTE